MLILFFFFTETFPYRTIKALTAREETQSDFDTSKSFVHMLSRMQDHITKMKTIATVGEILVEFTSHRRNCAL